MFYDLENTLTREFNEILKREEDCWKLKSRIQWINDGDANTNFFHTSTTNRRNRNKILGLNDSVGNWAFDTIIINKTILQHYQKVYTTEHNLSSFSAPPHCNQALTPENKSTIGRALSREEIKNVMFSFQPLKSPGPDGLHPLFFQIFWKDTEESVVTTSMAAFNT